MKNRYRHVYSFPNGMTVYQGNHDLNIKFPYGCNCLSDGTPLEDLGDYLLSENQLTPQEAFNEFINQLERS